MSSENLNQLIDAFKDYQDYQEFPDLEILRKLTPEQKKSLRYDDPLTSSDAELSDQLYKFEKAEAALIKAIDNYIDDRIKQLIRSIC